MAEVVVITGGSAGIGRAAARAFAARGDSVGLIARGAGRLEQARSELEAMGARVHTVCADVADAVAVGVLASGAIGLMALAAAPLALPALLAGAMLRRR